MRLIPLFPLVFLAHGVFVSCLRHSTAILASHHVRPAGRKSPSYWEKLVAPSLDALSISADSRIPLPRAVATGKLGTINKTTQSFNEFYFGDGGVYLSTGEKPLDGFSTSSPQDKRTVLTFGISAIVLFSAIPFGFLATFGSAENLIVYTWSAVVGYAVCSVTLALLFDFVPDLALLLVSLAGAGAAAFFSYKSPRKDYLILFILSLSCVLVAAVIYDVLAGIPLDIISPQYSGLAGVLFNTGFFSSSCIVLRLFYWLIIGGLSVGLYYCIPGYVRKDPVNAEEEALARIWTRTIMSFVCAWPVAGALTQVIYLFGASHSPLDPLSFFYLPSQARWTSWESYVAWAAWAGLTYLSYLLKIRLEKEEFVPELVSKDIREHWRKFTE